MGVRFLAGKADSEGKGQGGLSRGRRTPRARGREGSSVGYDLGPSLGPDSSNQLASAERTWASRQDLVDRPRRTCFAQP